MVLDEDEDNVVRRTWKKCKHNLHGPEYMIARSSKLL